MTRDVLSPEVYESTFPSAWGRKENHFELKYYFQIAVQNKSGPQYVDRIELGQRLNVPSFAINTIKTASIVLVSFICKTEYRSQLGQHATVGEHPPKCLIYSLNGSLWPVRVLSSHFIGEHWMHSIWDMGKNILKNLVVSPENLTQISRISTRA